jgi:hypothetical protein
LGVDFIKMEGGVAKPVLLSDKAAPASDLINCIFNQRELLLG